MDEDSITVEEQTHHYWKIGTYISALLCVIFFTLFWNLSSPFWLGIFRLVAFVFFALAILGYLNIMNGPMTIILRHAKEHLIVSYKKKNDTIQEEQYDLQTIEQVFPTYSKKNLIYRLFRPQSATLKINFNDSDRDLFLIEFGGRPLFFNRQTTEDIENFLSERGIDIEQR